MTNEGLKKHITRTAVLLGLWCLWLAVQSVVITAWILASPRELEGLWWALSPSWVPVGLAVGLVVVIVFGVVLMAVIMASWHRHKSRRDIEIIETDQPPPRGEIPN